MKVGLSGEVRFSVTDSDGNIRIDTGYQKNLILDQGLDFFGGGKGRYLNSYCLIGAGNSSPVATQTELDSVIGSSPSIVTTDDYSYTDDGDGLYKFWEEKKYRFEKLGAVNISEVGLASEYTSTSSYYLTTRTLVKDSLGSPTTISLKEGETLDVFYKVHKQFSTGDEVFQVSVLDGEGGTELYNVTTRPNAVGNSSNNDVSSVLGVIGGGSNASRNRVNFSNSELTSFKESGYQNQPFSVYSDKIKPSPYVAGSYKKTYTINVSIDDANIPEGIRSLYIRRTTSSFGDNPIKFLPLQLRFGKASDDTPLIKTDKDVLKIPIEYSWGRVEEEV